MNQISTTDPKLSQVEVTEDLINRDSSAHALDMLSKGRNTNFGQLDSGSGSQPSGTYAKPC